jgi:GT2 family glycosyltransferase
VPKRGRPSLPLIAAVRDTLRTRRGLDRFAAFQAQIEPVVAAMPRVHRFAAIPVLGDSATPVQDVVTADRAALGETRAPWVVLARASLGPAAIERFGQAASLAPDAAVITCDEDVADGDEPRRAPRFFPGPSPDHLLADGAPLAALCVRREAALTALAGIPDTPAWPLELLLRLGGPDGEGHAHVPAILAHRPAPPEPMSGALDAVARVVGLPVTGSDGRRRVMRRVSGEPLVEVVVLFRDRPELLERCARSVLELTAWERLRLRLVDNASVDPRVAELVGRLEGDARVTVRRDERPFNFAALNNSAVAETDADVLVFLNNDTEVVSPDWVEMLLGEARRPEVGAVAPLLRYPDGTVQHAGAALGLHGYAGHPFAGLRPDAETPFGRPDGGTRNWLAVTAACMMVDRHKFEAAGGFDESFVVAGNDVDLCLRLTARGHRSLCVPHVELIHDESRSRGAHIDPGDFARSEASYGAFRTIGDPFYNPNLTLTDTTCQPRRPGEPF